jgi:hydroxymethylbilane synthase
VAIGAVCLREDVRDCLVSREGQAFADLPPGAVVGTSSLRRVAQLRALRPDLEVRSIRGNVDTRIRKVRDGEYDATILAAAGVRRLGLEGEVSEWLDAETVLPAPGQGALAIQCRADDERAIDLLAAIDHATARATTTAERTFLRELGGGCAAPVAASATGTAESVALAGLVASPDGADMARVSGEGEPAEVGARLAREALARGADRILATIRG